MRIVRKFNDSVESERELRRFVEKLLPRICVEIVATVKGRRAPDFLTSRFESLLTLFIFKYELPRGLSDVYPSAFLSDFYDFISSEDNKRNSFRVRVVYDGGRHKGYYNGRDGLIHLTLSRKTMEEVITIVERVPSENIALTKVTNLLLNDYFHEMLLHEFTHAYDDFISKGKYMGKTYVKPGYSDEENAAYYSQDLEVNAFFSGIVKHLERFNWKYIYPVFDKLIDDLYFLSGYYGDIKSLPGFPKEKKERIISRIYQWYVEPPLNKVEERKGLEAYYTYLTNNHAFMTGFFLKSFEFSDFEVRSLLSREMKKAVPLALKGVASVDGAMDFFAETLKLFAKGRYRKQDFKKPFSTYREDAQNRIYVVGSLARMFELNYLEFQWELDDPDWLGDGSFAYQTCFGFIEYLSFYAGYTYKDFLRLDKEFPHKVPVTHLSVNTRFKELLMRNGG